MLNFECRMSRSRLPAEFGGSGGISPANSTSISSTVGRALPCGASPPRLSRSGSAWARHTGGWRLRGKTKWPLHVGAGRSRGTGCDNRRVSGGRRHNGASFRWTGSDKVARSRPQRPLAAPREERPGHAPPPPRPLGSVWRQCCGHCLPLRVRFIRPHPPRRTQ